MLTIARTKPRSQELSPGLPCGWWTPTPEAITCCLPEYTLSESWSQEVKLKFNFTIKTVTIVFYWLPEEICTLVIAEVFAEDSGCFTCTASNKYGTVSSIAQLDVRGEASLCARQVCTMTLSANMHWCYHSRLLFMHK